MAGASAQAATEEAASLAIIDIPPQSLDTKSSRSLHMCGVWGAVMQCLACRAENTMLLIDVVRDDTLKAPAIERRSYMCSACRHMARRVVFSVPEKPITHLPVIPIPIEKLWNRPAAPRNWANAVEKLRKKQIELKQRAAARAASGDIKAEAYAGGLN